MKAASFFTGIGGFDLAFEKQGVSIKFQCEIDSFCTKVLRKHWPDMILEDDINNVMVDMIPKSDIWFGGFPCQDVSLANQGKRKGLKGNRSGLFYKFAELVGQRKPSWVIIENVPGLLNSNNGKDFEVVIKTLMDFGYGVAWRVFDAKYFGTPQRRRRVFILASFQSLLATDVLFEEGLTRVLHKKDKVKEETASDLHLFNEKDEQSSEKIYTIQHATIGRKPEAGPQGKGFRCDGETYTLDSRGSADVICGINRRFTGENSTIVQYNSNRLRALGNAVAVPVVSWIAKRIVDVHEKNSKFITNNDLNNKLIKLFPGVIDIVIDRFEAQSKKWLNTGVVFGNSCWNANANEYPSEPINTTLSNIILDNAPLNSFLNKEKLQALLERWKIKEVQLPSDLKLAIEKQIEFLNKNPYINNKLNDMDESESQALQQEVAAETDNEKKSISSDDYHLMLGIRRMLPIEYERLQGFPDNWTKIV